MNGKLSKKIRKEVNKNTNDVVLALCRANLITRLVFAFIIIFKRNPRMGERR